MNPFLEKAYKMILNQNTQELHELVNQNLDAPVTLEETMEFSGRFSPELKKSLTGCININGSGGTGIYKPNISSVAAMYLAGMTGQKVVKTGSSAYRGLFGSSDFFRKMGLLEPKRREECLKRFHFAYYDYLEISPWKQYKAILRKNSCLDEIYGHTVYFDYPANYYFLGISSPEYYDSLSTWITMENQPDHIISYYTQMSQKTVDEAFPGKLFVNGRIFHEEAEKDIPLIGSKEEIIKIDELLLRGEEVSYWTEVLSLTCSMALCQLGYAQNMEEGKEMFKKAYKDQILKEIFSYLM